MLANPTAQRPRAWRRRACRRRCPGDGALAARPGSLRAGHRGRAPPRPTCPTAAGWLTGPVIYLRQRAGAPRSSSLDAHAAPLVIVATAPWPSMPAWLVLFRRRWPHHWRGHARWWQALAAYLLVDPSFAVGVARYERAGRSAPAAHAPLPRRRPRPVGHVWLAAIASGAAVGAQLPGRPCTSNSSSPCSSSARSPAGSPARRVRRAGLRAVGGGGRCGYAAPLHLGVVAADRRWGSRRRPRVHGGSTAMTAWLVVAGRRASAPTCSASAWWVWSAAADRRPASSAPSRSRCRAPSRALAAGAVTAACAGAGAPGAVAPLGAVAAAVVAVRRTRSPHMAIVVGMPTLWLLNALLGA